jgi:hypothetical protein
MHALPGRSDVTLREGGVPEKLTSGSSFFLSSSKWKRRHCWLHPLSTVLTGLYSTWSLAFAPARTALVGALSPEKKQREKIELKLEGISLCPVPVLA